MTKSVGNDGGAGGEVGAAAYQEVYAQPRALSRVEADSAEWDVLELDAAIDRLAAHDPRQAGIVELRFFGGQTAELLGVFERTVPLDLRMALAWLRSELGASGVAGSPDG